MTFFKESLVNIPYILDIRALEQNELLNSTVSKFKAKLKVFVNNVY